MPVLCYVTNICAFLYVLRFSVTNSEGVLPATCLPNQFRCDSGQCINNKWVCDGHPECTDGSDEIRNGIQCTGTCSSHEFRCDDGQCISGDWKCDESLDCVDESDESEKTCHNLEKTCDEESFKCVSDGICKPKLWVCDGSKDCVDGSDERNCSNTCKEDEFKCRAVTGPRCIVSNWVCDDESDCANGLDEKDCALKDRCMDGEFLCSNRRHCIDSKYRCDGDKDCSDGSDERNCSISSAEHQTCLPTEFQCMTSPQECINRAWVCDGDEDCLDGSDEVKDADGNKCVVKCKDHQIQCETDHVCIHENYKCDGIPQCQDGSDEFSCPSRHVCRTDQFDCHNNGRLCVDRAKVCDGVNNCGGFEDESLDLKECRELNPCLLNNGNCSHECINLHMKHRCTCKLGYKLDVDKQTCVDIDECKTRPGICSQSCENTIGGYKCRCLQGYHLIDKGHCKSIDRPLLLFANRKDIRQIDLDSQEFRLVVSNLSGAVALDMHYNRSWIYWTDVTLKKIQSGIVQKDGTIKDESTLLSENVSKPNGLAVDWIHDLLFWTDSDKHSIEVMSLQKGAAYRTTVIRDGLDHPRAIVVDPESGFVYWSECGASPKIERSNMDGSDRRVIVSDDIKWPNGLTYDYTNRKLYWMDAKLHLVGITDRDGNNPSIIRVSKTIIRHPFAVAVFEDLLYWTDWRSNGIHSINKFTGMDDKTLLHKLKKPMGIRIFHSHSQKNTINYCDGNQCAHLCVPTPHTQPLYRCLCSDFTDTSCITGKSHAIKYNVDAGVTSRPDHPHVILIANRTHDTPHHIGSTGSQRSGLQPMMVAVIAISVVLTVSVILIAVLLIYKRRRGATPITLNFDNPVYRKTTDENCSIMKNGNDRSLPTTMQPLAENEYV